MPANSTWALAAAAVAAVVTVTAAGFVLADRAPTSVKKITGTSADTPGLAWSLDAAELLGRPFADFSDPRGGASYNSGTPGFVLSGDTLVALAGVPNDGYSLDDAVMIGIDPDDGTVRWKTPAADLEQCSGQPLGGLIYCYAMQDGYDIVTYDVESGASERRSIPESVFGLTTTADTLYIVEGSPEENDVRVHSGTFDDVSANWTRSYDIGAGYEELYDSEIVKVADGVGLVQTGSEMVQFDATTGAPLWSGDDCVYDARLQPGGVVVQANTDCESYDSIAEQLIRGPDGGVLVTVASPDLQRPTVDQASGTQGPLLLGDSAYDRRSGERLWGNTDLVAGDPNARGTANAVVGDIVYLRDVTEPFEAGISLRTGKQLWRNDTVQTFTPVAAEGNVLVGDDGTALTAFDVRTGRAVWTAPFSAIDADPETFASGGALEWYDDTWIYSSDRRMIGLAPRQ